MQKGLQKALVLNFEDMENKLYEMYALFIYFSITWHLTSPRILEVYCRNGQMN